MTEAINASPLRVAVVGVPGSGKTTVARKIGVAIGAPVIEVDALYWQPNWVPISSEDLVEHVQRLTTASRWVLDGQYAALRGLVASRADVVIWLDLGMRRCFPRLVRRTLRRAVVRRPLWNGNRETVWHAIGPMSVLWYALSVYRSIRRENVGLLSGLNQRQVGFRATTVGSIDEFIGEIQALMERKNQR